MGGRSAWFISYYMSSLLRVFKNIVAANSHFFKEGREAGGNVFIIIVYCPRAA